MQKLFKVSIDQNTKCTIIIKNYYTACKYDERKKVHQCFFVFFMLKYTCIRPE